MEEVRGEIASEAALFADDPEWALCVPEMKSGGDRCGLPAHTDCSPLDPDGTAAHLKPGGTLGGERGYEERPGQLDVLRAIVNAFNDRSHLMIEAGTGVGKSLAYLVPAVNWAVLNDTPVVVSTATRNLQSQLISSDIPRAVRTVPGKVRVAVLKGRGNYLCLRALAELMQEGYYRLRDDERTEFAALVRWLQTPGCDGDLDGVNVPRIRSRIVCTGEDCAGRRCHYSSRCFVRKARDAAMRAHLIVANHALVITEASCPGSGLLPAYGRLVFDEAHNIEDVATDCFSFEFSKASFEQMTGRITRKRKGRDKEKGVAGLVAGQLVRGDLKSAANASDIAATLQDIRTACAFARLEADTLLAVASRMASPGTDSTVLRYRRPCIGGVPGPRQYSENGLFADYPADRWDERELDAALLKFESRLAALANSLVRLARTLEEACEGELNLYGDMGALAVSAADGVKTYLASVKMTLTGDDPERVYWYERTPAAHGARGAAGGKTECRFVSAPLSIADEMRRYFHKTKDSVILCSATLRVGDKFDYMAKRLGCAGGDGEEDGGGRFRKLVAASPFDYFRQSLVMAADFLPDPAQNSRSYADALAPFLQRLFAATRGRGLVLFTAYDMMGAVAAQVRPLLEEEGIELLVQGEGITREEMSNRLKAGEKPTVLFGSQSFWEGVDVAGDALSCVVIARLPFPQMREPVAEARCSRIEESGGNSFFEFMVPEAVIKFRQGFGRLVRTKRDRGVVVVADRRIVTKNYGAQFRKSIAASVHTVRTEDELLSRAEEFLGP